MSLSKEELEKKLELVELEFKVLRSLKMKIQEILSMKENALNISSKEAELEADLDYQAVKLLDVVK